MSALGKTVSCMVKSTLGKAVSCMVKSALAKTVSCVTMSILIFSFDSAQASKIILLTSIDPTEFSFSKGHLLKDLETEFRDSFKDHGKDSLEVHHYVDQHQLYQIIQAPGYDALFWVSHGRHHAIYDWRGFEISAVFQQAHPDFRAIAAISCYSAWLLKDPHQRWITFDSFVDARHGLTQALREVREILSEKDMHPSESDLQSTLVLHPSQAGLVHAGRAQTERAQARRETGFLIRRNCRSDGAPRTGTEEKDPRAMSSQAISKEKIYPVLRIYPALRIEDTKGRVIATLPECREGEEIRRELEASREILITTGQHRPSVDVTYEVGQIRVRSLLDPAREWSPLLRKDGTPWGGQISRFFRE